MFQSSQGFDYTDAARQISALTKKLKPKMTMTPLSIKQNAYHNGFKFDGEIAFNSPIVVLIGKNGSGKSRLFDALKNGTIEAKIGDSIINPQAEIVKIESHEFIPKFGMNYQTGMNDQTVQSALSVFKELKDHWHLPYERHNEKRDLHRGYYTYKRLYPIVNNLAKTLQKEIIDLTDDDISLHFLDVDTNPVGLSSISKIFNGYHEKHAKNKTSRLWELAGSKAKKNYTEDEFTKIYGDPPWETMNDVLARMFDNKFKFQGPDLDQCPETFSQDFSHLIQNNGSGVNVKNLSSGEQTLLWLSLTLFNAKYSPDFHQAPKLLLLDEPDAFLHPKMVQKMYAALQIFHDVFDVKIILISHSPTTAALAPDNSLYCVEPNKVCPVNKDQAIAALLDGVTQIAIDPENRRQVFVESFKDQEIYQNLFNFLKNRDSCLDPAISLHFISSGAKISEEHIQDAAQKHLLNFEPKALDNFIKHLNGIGSCSHVKQAVKDLECQGNKTVRGVIDWDGKNKKTASIQVLGEDIFYTLENIIFDPICMALVLHDLAPKKHPLTNFLNHKTESITSPQLLEREELLQEVLDNTLKMLGIENDKMLDHEYLGGFKLKHDTEYARLSKNSLIDDKWFEKFPELKTISKKISNEIVNKKMIDHSNGKLIPRLFVNLLIELQKQK